MKTNRTTVHKTGARLEPVAWLSEATRRRMSSTLSRVDEQSAKASRSLARELAALRAQYRREIAALIGAAGMRRYRQLRIALAKAPRARRVREAEALLIEIGFDRVRAERLRKRYLAATRRLLDDVRAQPAAGVAIDRRCTPWVTYTPPYAGSFWSIRWHRSDEASDPVINRYLDQATGHIGSAINTRLSGADDDDSLSVEVYTCLHAWHTAQATGPLEGFVALEFRNSTYSGNVSDEFGFSSATFSQFALARFRVTDNRGTVDTPDSRIFNFIDTDWGDGKSWSNFVSTPRDIHWYYFRTEASFAHGSPLLLEAGVHHTAWFSADDESIRTAADLDLRLERIVVRSCP